MDRVRPPWEALLVTGLDGGRAAYLLKVHHSLADGLALVTVLDLLHGTDREPTDHGDETSAPQPDPVRSRQALTARRLGQWALGVPVDVLGGLATTSRLVAGLVARPVAGTARAGATVASAVRAALPRQGPPSPLLAERSLNRRFLALDVDLDRLRRAGHAGGGSLNDAFLAAVLGGLRRYHAHFGAVPDTIPTGMPISTRTGGDPLGGNRWAGTRFAGPLAGADPAARIAQVRRIVTDLVDEPVLDGLGLIAPVLAALPSGLLVRIQGDATMGNDLQVSNIPGLSRPAFLAGARIERSYPFAPLPGGALMVALMSHREICCVGVNLDPAAVTAPGVLAECLDAGFAEVLDLADDPRPRGDAP